MWAASELNRDRYTGSLAWELKERIEHDLIGPVPSAVKPTVERTLQILEGPAPSRVPGRGIGSADAMRRQPARTLRR
jgi:hypothetical protein